MASDRADIRLYAFWKALLTKGWFKDFLTCCEEIAQKEERFLKVENVLNPVLVDFLRQRMYCENDESFWKHWSLQELK
jgi:hypothetical protein